jgi:small nuclear ribonucleoprotein (snRNP)-like protein
MSDINFSVLNNKVSERVLIKLCEGMTFLTTDEEEDANNYLYLSHVCHNSLKLFSYSSIFNREYDHEFTLDNTVDDVINYLISLGKKVEYIPKGSIEVNITLNIK